MKSVFSTINLLAICAFASGCGLSEFVDSSDIVVIQSQTGGKLAVYVDPGWKWQGMGDVTTYKKSTQYWFSAEKDEGDSSDQSILIQFSDTGKAWISGSIRVIMPLDAEHLVLLRQRFSGGEAQVLKDLVRPTIEKAVYMAGQTMSSTESSSAKKGLLFQYIEDQILHGVYRTQPHDVKAKDPISGEEKTVTLVEILVDKEGNPQRVDVSPFDSYGITVNNLSIKSIRYDVPVQEQIDTQRKALMAIQTAMAAAKEAEQRKLTTEQSGMADAAKAKWDQEVLKAKAVTQAQQEFEVAEKKAQQTLRVAELDRAAAEQTKLKDILLGQGESERRKLAMIADGALSQKLSAWVEVNQAWAAGFAGYNGNITPSVVMGNGAAASTNAVEQYMQMLAANSARQMGLDMQMDKGKGRTEAVVAPASPPVVAPSKKK